LEQRNSGRDRRQQNFSSVVYGCLHPRREENRRPADDQWCLIDAYDPGLIMVSLSIVLMSCLDAFFTLELLSMGANEINYFMKVLIDSDTSSFLTAKLLITCGGVVFLTAMARFRIAGVVRVRRILEALCGVYACLIVWELFLLAAVAIAGLA
jgi:hypothetical protein